jgi:hypothetical protein
MRKMRVGIKYCGGCNPTYERVDMVKRLEEELGERFLFLTHDAEALDALLLINGCPKACADEGENRAGIPLLSVWDEHDFHRAEAWLKAL